MELKPGYKQTEVGIIPQDWQTATLGSLTVLMTNGFVGTATTHYTANENGVLYIQGYNVEENSFNFHGIKFVTEEFHRAHMKSCLRDGDLLTVQTGEVGLTTVVPDSLAGSNCHALIISRFHQKHVSPVFVSYYLNSKPGRSRLSLIETGTTMKHLNVGDMLHFSVPFPPTKAEQEAIAEVLHDTDSLIESMEQLIVKKRRLEQGAMQELLTGRRRLPGFGVRLGYKHTEVGAVPEDWDVKTLGDLFTFQNGVNADKSAYGSGVAFINVLEIITYQTLTESRIPGKVQLSPQARSAFAVQFGDVLFNRTSETQEELALAAVYTGNSEVVFGGFVIRARPRTSSIDPILASYLLRSPCVRSQIVAWGQGAIRANIGQHDLARVQLPLPGKAEQKAIAAVLSEMDAEMTALDAKLAKARQLKQGLMQELLSGKTRLV